MCDTLALCNSFILYLHKFHWKQWILEHIFMFNIGGTDKTQGVRTRHLRQNVSLALNESCDFATILVLLGYCKYQTCTESKKYIFHWKYHRAASQFGGTDKTCLGNKPLWYNDMVTMENTA